MGMLGFARLLATLTDACGLREIKYIRNLCIELFDCREGVLIATRCDNQSSIKIAEYESVTQSQRTKHLDVRYNFIKDFWKNGEIDLKYVESEKNHADIFTKPVSKPKLRIALASDFVEV